VFAPQPSTLTRGQRVIAFIEGYCRVPEGAKVGQPLRLAEFQKRFILAIYDNPRGTRRAYLSIARKNGKSALIAAILLAHIVGPEAKTNSQIISGAMSRDQAALVYKLAVKMIKLNPKLDVLCKIGHGTKMITGLARNVEYFPISAESATAHGLSPVLAILDEVGQVKGPISPFVEAITTSQGAHDEPLLIAISTSAPSDADMFSQWLDDAIRSGDPHTVAHEYRAPDNCDLLDEMAMRAANPGLGHFRNYDDLVQNLEKAVRLPALEASARNLLLNQRIALESLWLAPSIWRNNDTKPSLDILKRGPSAIAFDLSGRLDLTAAVVAARNPDSLMVSLLPFVFTPLSGLEERARRDRAPYDQWIREGKLIAVPGASVDYKYVAEFMRDALKDLDINPETVLFDRWRIADFRTATEAAGFLVGAAWLEVGQGFKDMSPRIESFEAALSEYRVAHGGHPLLNLAAANAIATRDAAGNRKLDKAKTSQRIDPLVASVMALHAVDDGAQATGDPRILFV
jgi:phage terminase large subunit-like protein